MIDTSSRHPLTATPRLLVVGLLVCGVACHRRPPVPTPVPVATVPPAPAPRPAPLAITSAARLIAEMHDRYATKWYHTLTFTQKTTLAMRSGGELVQTWYEAGEMPGHLRIDTDLPAKTGVLYAHDSSYRFANGKLVQADTVMNPLLVLGFDVYAQPVARTEAILRRLGFDQTRFHETTWQGRAVYVVGATRGDTTSTQFWVERDRLLFVRMLQYTRLGHIDFRFNNYVESGGGWVAEDVEQFVNGKRQLHEQYSDIRTNVPLSTGLFDPKQWATAPHWAR